MRLCKIHTLCGLLLSSLLSACVTTHNTSLNLGSELTPPKGWQIYCAEQKTTYKPDPACLDSGRWRQISNIHNHINKSVVYKPDTQNIWQIAQQTGDCEDFTLRYRAELLNKGWKSKNLLPALCKTPEGTHHMNLLVNTNQGIWVLDNRHNSIKPYTQVQCNYIALYQPS